MEKTVIQKLLNDIKIIHSRGIELTPLGIITMLENSLEDEKSQIIKAFNEGIKYGEGSNRFDYPNSRYYYFTYPNEIF